VTAFKHRARRRVQLVFSLLVGRSHPDRDLRTSRLGITPYQGREDGVLVERDEPAVLAADRGAGGAGVGRRGPPIVEREDEDRREECRQKDRDTVPHVRPSPRPHVWQWDLWVRAPITLRQGWWESNQADPLPCRGVRRLGRSLKLA